MKVQTVKQANERVMALLHVIAQSLNQSLKREMIDNSIVIDEWLVVMPFEATETVRTILGSTPSNVIHYEISKIEFHKGVYRYKDGSGDPDSSEEVVIKTCKSDFEVVTEVMKIWFDNHISSMLESVYENELDKEIREYEQEYNKEIVCQKQ